MSGAQDLEGDLLNAGPPEMPRLSASDDEEQSGEGQDETTDDALSESPEQQQQTQEEDEATTTALRDQFVHNVVRMAAVVADNHQQQHATETPASERPILELLSATLMGAANFAHGQRDSTTTIAEYESPASDSDEDGGVLMRENEEEGEQEEEQESDGDRPSRRRESNFLPEGGDSDEEAHDSEFFVDTQTSSVAFQPVFTVADLSVLDALGNVSASVRRDQTQNSGRRARRSVRQTIGENSVNQASRAGPVLSRNNNNNSESDSPDDDGVRIRVPMRFVDASATSSSAPRQQSAASQPALPQHGRHADPDATSRSAPRVDLFSNMSTTTSQQTTPDTQAPPPMRPRPDFARESAESRRVAYPSIGRQQQQMSVLPDPLQFVQSLVSGSLFDPNLLSAQQQLNDESEGFQFVRASLNNMQSCTHGIDAEHTYADLFDVPLTVCEMCNSAVIAPSDRDENVAKALRFPESMKRDDRFQQLFDMHKEHVETINSIKELLDKQRSISLRLFEWNRHYSDRLPRNYSAQNNPCYRELSRSLDRYTNALQAFCNMSAQMATAHRRRFTKAVHRTFPRNQIYFKAAMRYEIHKAQPNPLLLPGTSVLPRCTVCDEEANVRLHTHSERYELVRLDPFAREPTRQPIRQCQCQEFVMCLDCLLDWYYDSSEKLTKSFAKCPTCKAQFHLEDIVRVRTMSSTTAGKPEKANE